jgi:electron transport complex protein RnfB
MNRRKFIVSAARLGALGVLGGGVAKLVARGGDGKACGLSGPCGECRLRGECSRQEKQPQPAEATVWQIDPHKCIQCGKCATECVLAMSAARCFHAHAVCGYCDLCTGFFEAQPNGLNTGAENQLCPTGAIKRSFIEDPYFEYTIDRDLCIGCSKCVKGCTMFGNGSLFLQIDHSRCVNCNECRIALNCPSHAITRVPASTPYHKKTTARTG